MKKSFIFALLFEKKEIVHFILNFWGDTEAVKRGRL